MAAAAKGQLITGQHAGLARTCSVLAVDDIVREFRKGYFFPERIGIDE